MSENNPGNVTLKLHGRDLGNDVAPAFLSETRRSASGSDDPFLPRDWVQVARAVDLSATARSSGAEAKVPAQSGQVLVFELPDGSTLITSPDKLEATLRNIDPTALDAAGNIDLSKALATRSGATRDVFGSLKDGLESIASRVFSLSFNGDDAIIDEARRKAREWIGEKAGDKLGETAELGVTWLGTKALMWAIESRLDRAPGLYRWTDQDLGESFGDDDPRLAQAALQGPLLVFLHGTGSSTTGSFSDLRTPADGVWKLLEAKYGERIFGLEHRTLSESPIENALQLARVLPAGAQLHLVSHSRGGLVGDLLCLDAFDDLIAGYALDERATLGVDDEQERRKLIEELTRAHAEQRQQLHDLRAVLAAKQFKVERFVRVASPARGTRLASANFDAFLSGLLSLIGWVPALKGQPLYSAFKRVVLEIARNRTRPNLVPGIEAMLPESPMARFLLRARPRKEVRLGVVAGDLEGGNPLKRLGALLTDYLIFDGLDNDLIVDTGSMYAGIARAGQALALSDQGPRVTHFNYFANERTRHALRDWLLTPDPLRAPEFEPLPGSEAEPSEAEAEERLRQVIGTRSASAQDSRPVVVLLPGIMGSHLQRDRDRIWFSPLDLALGGLNRIRWSAPRVSAESLLDRSYGDLTRYLSARYRVERFAYDWRQPLDELGGRFAKFVQDLSDKLPSEKHSVSVLAHSMGGLVVRAMIHQKIDLWRALMKRDNARFIMLGTPNQGSFSMVQTLIGKDESVRKLGWADLKNSQQEVLDVVAEFRGALQLLPRKGLVEPGGQPAEDFFSASIWTDIRKQLRDPWIGDKVCATPAQDVLDAARWLWNDGVGNQIPQEFKDRTCYVFGQGENLTPCGMKLESGRWKMQGTRRGDGTVTWTSGEIPGIGHRFYMPTRHGEMANDEAHFGALAELVEQGKTDKLATVLPAPSADIRAAVGAPELITYDAGPVVVPTAQELAGGLFGSAPRRKPRAVVAESLSVKVCAMDLRCVTQPVLVGHFDEDPISGAESVIDHHLVHDELSVRHHLGLYAGRIGTASAVLIPPNAQERERGSFRGAVVTGLGKYDGNLTSVDLLTAVRTGALRYLLHMQEMLQSTAPGQARRELTLATVLLGYNSTVNISIVDSVNTLIRGVLDANRKFAEQSGSKLRIASIEIVELYLNTAITAAHAIRKIAEAINAEPQNPVRVEAAQRLETGEGYKQRLDDGGSGSYWPRLIVSDHDRPDLGCPPECSGGDKPPLPPCDPSGNPPATPQRPAPAETLRFLLLGQRARAESLLQRRQPGMVESLVDSQMQQFRYNADLCRTLFQLLIPQDLKDSARQMDRLILVLDRYTADLPWELMQADEVPLATRVSVIRQLSTSRFRAKVNQTSASRAYVLGNPSSRNFGRVFVDADRKPAPDPVNLAAAESEAAAVANVLAGNGYEVRRLLGSDVHAVDAVTALYRQSYRILHIAAHGVHEERDVHGRLRSGVVLSDGQLLSAAEIGAMETVPDFVFLNCCHLGKTGTAAQSGGTAYNRLAYSVSRELIEMGVRAVIAAGWAVGDQSGQFFAETFYRELLQNKRPFGDAVFHARCETWKRHPGDMTWGAYQAYGDPGWVAEGRNPTPADPLTETFVPVSLDELLARIEADRLHNRRTAGRLSDADKRRADKVIRHLLKQSRHLGVDNDPSLFAKLGEVYADLGPSHYEEACDYYSKAIRAEDKRGTVPIRVIEQFAELEARSGEPRRDPDGKLRGDLAPIERSIQRMQTLIQLTTAGDPDTRSTVERRNILGSAYKSLAIVHAYRLALESAADAKHLMAQALTAAYREYAYHSRGDDADGEGGDASAAVNCLFLLPLIPDRLSEAEENGFLVKTSGLVAAAFARDRRFQGAILAADFELAKALRDGALGREDMDGDRAIDRVKHTYSDVRAGIAVKAGELDSVVRQVLLLARYYRVGIAPIAHEESLRVSDRLLELANNLQPGVTDSMTLFLDAAKSHLERKTPRNDEPLGPGPAGAPAAKRSTRKKPK